jgi:hypothetical protein
MMNRTPVLGKCRAGEAARIVGYPFEGLESFDVT